MITFHLNGKHISFDGHPGTTLFDYLRDKEVFSVKFGSEKGETGSDAVLVDGQIMNSSLLLIHQIEGQTIETIESFSSGTNIHSLQDIFIEEGAVQCGYCTPALILAAESLIRENLEPTETDIKEAISGVYCRCTGYVKPVKAIQRYLNEMGGSQ